MGRIEIPSEALARERGPNLQRAFAALKPKVPIPWYQCSTNLRGATAIALHDGRGRADLDHRACLFGPNDSLLRFNYFELWKPTDAQQACWSLNRAYLNVTMVPKGEHNAQKLFCIHCDPDDKSAYKRGPHLHVDCLDPLGKCHFPLCLTDFDSVLESIDSITRAFAMVAELIKLEVMPRYSKWPKTVRPEPAEDTGGNR